MNKCEPVIRKVGPARWTAFSGCWRRRIGPKRRTSLLEGKQIPMNNAEILKRYYNAMEQHDWNTKRSLMCDDLRFRGPLLQANSADELLAGIKQFNCDVRFTDVEMVEKGNVVMSFFTFNISKPF